VEKQDKTMMFVSEKARRYDPDPAHNEAVTNLALTLFDGLHILHGYGPKERRLLEIAGRLHDIGWSQVVSGKHHKLSARLILDLAIPGVGEEDQATVALIARYHTKALPETSRHRRFAALPSVRRELVEWLAGILRVADSLDCSHSNHVKQLTCTISGKVVTIHLQVSGDCRVEIEQATQKDALLVRKAERKIRYLC
jgi:exopolyphosphatase / guanosine-5'-triphosphate,3'-diphosphate pyrophosphatase